MDRYVIVESPDTGAFVDLWVCEESELEECCRMLGERHEYLTVRPLPANFSGTMLLNKIIWRY